MKLRFVGGGTLKVVPRPSDGQRMPFASRVKSHYNRILDRFLAYFDRPRGRSMLCMLIFLTLAFGAVSPAQAGVDDYNLAIGLYKKSRWELARDAFAKFLKENPGHRKVPSAQLYYGMTLRNLRKYDESRKMLRTFIQKSPNNRNLPYAMFRVGECSYFLDDWKQARTEFSAFVDKYPNHELTEWALPNLADVQHRLGDLRAAVAAYRKSIAKFPRGRLIEDSKYGLARALEVLKEFDEALDLYKQLAANKTSNLAPRAQLNLATRYFESGKFEQSAQSYDDLEENFPKSPLVASARINAGYAYYQLGAFRKAIAAFERAAQSKEQAATANYWMALSRKSLGEYEPASKTLKSIHDAEPKGPLAQYALFHHADCILRLSEPKQARALFLRVVKNWPSGEWADDSLYFAAEAALLEGDVTAAENLIQQFQKQFPKSDLRSKQLVLHGRVLEQRGSDASLRAAMAAFQGVLNSDPSGRSSQFARYYLARVHGKLGDHKSAVKVLTPLVEQIKKENKTSELIAALVLYGESQFHVGDLSAADDSMSLYLERQPEGDYVTRALSTRALAAAKLGKQDEARAHIAALKTRSPDDAVIGNTLRKIAEAAYDAENWGWASENFAALVERGSDAPSYLTGLSGLAWCEFQLGHFDQAAQRFSEVVEAAPAVEPPAPEAAYMHARSLYEAGKLESAAQAYDAAYVKLSADESVDLNDDEGAGFYAYRAGLQAARTFRQLEKVDEADNSYQRLATRFSHAKKIDKLLDEWALLHYETGNYEKSDELFARLIRQAPDSDLADNARLSLGESHYISGRLDEAEKVFRELESSSKSDDEVQQVALKHLVSINVERHQWEEVGSLAERLLKRFPKCPYRRDVEFHQAEALLNLNDVDAAQKKLLELKSASDEKQVRESDWFSRIWILLAEISYRQKNYDDVANYIKEMRAKAPESPLLYQGDEILGRSYRNQAEFDQARAAFTRVIDDETGRRTETAAKSQFMLAETYMTQKKYRKAQLEYLKVYTLYEFPDWQAPALYQAAQCDEVLEQWKDAVQTYGDLIKEFPDSEYAKKAKTKLPVARKQASG